MLISSPNLKFMLIFFSITSDIFPISWESFEILNNVFFIPSDNSILLNFLLIQTGGHSGPLPQERDVVSQKEGKIACQSLSGFALQPTALKEN